MTTSDLNIYCCAKLLGDQYSDEADLIVATCADKKPASAIIHQAYKKKTADLGEGCRF